MQPRNIRQCFKVVGFEANIHSSFEKIIKRYSKGEGTKGAWTNKSFNDGKWQVGYTFWCKTSNGKIESRAQNFMIICE